MNPPHKGKYVTDAELAVWRGIALGQMDKEMADARGVGIRCINKIRETLMRKLAVHCVADVTRMAVKYGLIMVISHPLRTELAGRFRRHYL